MTLGGFARGVARVRKYERVREYGGRKGGVRCCGAQKTTPGQCRACGDDVL